jgi:hypothetical protein
MLAAEPRASFVLYLEGEDPTLCSSYLSIPGDDPIDLNRRRKIGEIVKPTVLVIVGDRKAGQLVYLLGEEAIREWPLWSGDRDPGRPIGRLESVKAEDVLEARSKTRRAGGEEDDQEVLSGEILDRKAWRLVVVEDPVILLGQVVLDRGLPIATWDLGSDVEIGILLERLVGTELEAEAQRYLGPKWA